MTIVCAHGAWVRVSASALRFLFFFPSCLPICFEQSINLSLALSLSLLHSLSLSLRRSVNRCAVNHSFGFPFISPSSQWLKREQQEEEEEGAQLHYQHTHWIHYTSGSSAGAVGSPSATRFFPVSIRFLDCFMTFAFSSAHFGLLRRWILTHDRGVACCLSKLSFLPSSTSICFYLHTVFWFCLPKYFLPPPNDAATF